jgi:hypothetical protein
VRLGDLKPTAADAVGSDAFLFLARVRREGERGLNGVEGPLVSINAAAEDEHAMMTSSINVGAKAEQPMTCVESEEEDNSTDTDGVGPQQVGVFRAFFLLRSRQHATRRRRR